MSRSSAREDIARTVGHTQFRVNNFDLIRLLAALQAVYRHDAKLMDVMDHEAPIVLLLKRLPGVPIFKELRRPYSAADVHDLIARRTPCS